MFAFNTAIVALSALTLVSAGTSNFTIPDSGQVTLATRATWCTSERNTCDNVCNPSTQNDCDPTALTWFCKCADGSQPDLNEYDGSLASFVCQEAFRQCNLAAVGSAAGQKNCTDTIQKKCGTKKAGSAATASPSGAATTSGGSGTASSATGASTAAASSTSSRAGAMPTNVQHLGNGAVAVGVGLLAYML